jgi:tetratricopeptide (TPR) repeat protein
MALYDQRDQVVGTQYNAARDIHISQGIPEEQYRRLTEELGVTRAALTSFFNILEQHQVPPEDLDHTLRQIAASYKDLHAKLQRFTSDDPAVVALTQQAREALEAGEFAHAEALLNEAAAKDIEAATHLQETAAKRLVSAAASVADIGELKMTQLAYADALSHFQQAAGLIESLPTAPQDTLAEYLAACGRAAYEAGDYGQQSAHTSAR